MEMIAKRKILVFSLAIVAAILIVMMIIVLNLYWQSGSKPFITNDHQHAGIKAPGKGKPVYNNSMAENRGGRITFSLRGSAYEDRAEIELFHDNLQSINGDEIPSDIYYTLDGSEPTRESALKYTPGKKIILTKPGNHTIKAKLIATKGKYQGDVYSQTYMIKPKQKITPETELTKAEPQKSVGPAIETITDFRQLDEEIRKDIYECTKKLLFVLAGIEKIEKVDRRIEMEIYISQYGQAKMEQISGIVVTPADKEAEVKAALAEMIKSIKFLSPTSKGKPVKAKFWIDFEKVAYLGNKIMLER